MFSSAIASGPALAEVAPSGTVIVVAVGVNVTLRPEDVVGDPRVTSPLELKVRNMYRICDLAGADEGRGVVQTGDSACATIHTFWMMCIIKQTHSRLDSHGGDAPVLLVTGV
jgi:hypothetical protein